MAPRKSVPLFLFFFLIRSKLSSQERVVGVGPEEQVLLLLDDELKLLLDPETLNGVWGVREKLSSDDDDEALVSVCWFHSLGESLLSLLPDRLLSDKY